jgi:hypothetical protein
VNKSHTQVDLDVALSVLGTCGGPYGRTLNTGLDPVLVETVGAAIADRLREHEPDVLVIWDSSDEAVLAHTVANRLKVRVARAFEESGLLFLDQDLAPGARAALLATVWASPRRLSSLALLTEVKRATVVVAAAVFGTSWPATEQDVPTLWLTEEER